MQSRKAIKIISIFILSSLVCSLSGCSNISEEDSALISNNVLESVSENIIPNDNLASDTENIQSGSEITESESDTSSIASETNNVVNYQTSSKIESSNQSTATKSQCSHPKFWGDGILVIYDWHDRLPGVENRYTLTPNTCTENRKVVYKCPVCSEPVLYEEIEPLGHNFSEEEELLTYPSGKSDGSYGYRCQNNSCSETQISRTIPKLTGDYSGIDSCFSILSGTEKEDIYKIEYYLTIFDERTGGSIPTIRYDVNALRGEIELINANGELVKYSIYLEQDKLDDGWHYRGFIRDNSYYVDYCKLA